MPLNMNSNGYIIGFATAVCLVSSIFVSGAAVSLKSKQKANALLDLQKNVVAVSGLTEKTNLVQSDIDMFFATEATERIEEFYIELASGQVVDKKTVDDHATANKGACPQPKNNSPKIKCLPKYKRAFKVLKNNVTDKVIIEIEGKGLWSTLKGFLALDSTGKTIKGITFYSHKETPGLGGEVDNPKWKAEWPGKVAFDNAGKPQVKVIKGAAASGSNTEVSGLSGATLTANGVSNLVQFWLGEEGYGKYLNSLGRGA